MYHVELYVRVRSASRVDSTSIQQTSRVFGLRRIYVKVRRSHINEDHRIEAHTFFRYLTTAC